MHLCHVVIYYQHRNPECSRPVRHLVKADLSAWLTFAVACVDFCALARIYREHGLTPLQYQAILQIAGHPGVATLITIGELAERQAQPHGAVSLVTRCEAVGLVQRRVGRTDRRQVEVHLTRKEKLPYRRWRSTSVRNLRMLKEEFSLPG
ncbi:MAG: MarR family transcriptional regulator [Betaproteobacteria bacterium]|nr:MarR family transcriptional regulator [Betaproteobacteria bacterium]